jgi:hypothetical protein
VLNGISITEIINLFMNNVNFLIGFVLMMIGLFLLINKDKISNVNIKPKFADVPLA